MFFKSIIEHLRGKHVVRVMYLSPGAPSPPGSTVMLAPGHVYKIVPGRHGVWALYNDFDTPLGFLQPVGENVLGTAGREAIAMSRTGRPPSAG